MTSNKYDIQLHQLVVVIKIRHERVDEKQVRENVRIRFVGSDVLQEHREETVERLKVHVVLQLLDRRSDGANTFVRHASLPTWVALSIALM